jgi:hypothetical protein
MLRCSIANFCPGWRYFPVDATQESLETGMPQLDVSAKPGYSPITANATSTTPAAAGANGHSPLAGHVKTEAPATSRALPLRLLDLARTALRKIAAALPGAARSQAKATGGPLLQPEPDDAGKSAPPPAERWSLSDEEIRGHADEDLQARAEFLRNTGRRLAKLRQMTPKEPGPAFNEDELRLIDMDARVRAEVVRRANDNIEKTVASLVASVASFGHRPHAGAALGRLMKNVFFNADEALRELEEKHGLNIDTAITERGTRITGGARRIAVASLFVAAELGQRSPEDRQLLLGAMRPSDLKRLATADPTGGAASTATAAVIAAAKDELARRGDQMAQSFQSAAETFLAQHPAGETIRMQDLSDFLSDLQTAGLHLGVLSQHLDGLGESLSPESKALRDKVGVRLQEWLDSEPSLNVLEAQEFGRVVAALTQFGAPPSPVLLKLEAAAHVRPLEAQYQKAADTMVKGLVDQNPHAMLEGLEDMAKRFPAVHDAHHRLLRDTNSPEEAAALRTRFIRNALAKLEPEQAQAALRTIASIPFRAMIDGLGAASEAAQALGGVEASLEADPEAQRQAASMRQEQSILLNTMGRYVEEAALAVGDDAARRLTLNAGEEVWLSPTQMQPPAQVQRPDHGRRVTAGRMTNSYRKAFNDVLNIEIQNDGKPLLLR